MPRINSQIGQCWMQLVLWAAAIYNVVWGTFVVLFPSRPFEWISIDPPNYLSLWQCIGMMVGVYGVGYAIAAYDPIRHWPVVLVGLLGKVFGPIGFVLGRVTWRIAVGRRPDDPDE